MIRTRHAPRLELIAIGKCHESAAIHGLKVIAGINLVGKDHTDCASVNPGAARLSKRVPLTRFLALDESLSSYGPVDVARFLVDS